jgi:Mn2+/Fe2+ NRAMP family transporter
MGEWVNRLITTVAASAVAGLIICLNAYLLITLHATEPQGKMCRHQSRPNL